MTIMNGHVNLMPKHVEGSGVHQDTSNAAAGKKVDRWHWDTVAFVLVIFCTPPAEYTGGQFQFFDGTTEEGQQLLKEQGKIPSHRVRDVGVQHQGWAILQQGSQVLHQATAAQGNARTTLVLSYVPKDVRCLDACSVLSKTYNSVDPLHVLLPDWARYRAWKGSQRLQLLLSEQASKLDGAARLKNAISECQANLVKLSQQIEFTDDRQFLCDSLARAAEPLMKDVCRVETNQDAEFAAISSIPTESAILMECQAVLSELADCQRDIQTLSNSTMAYF